MFFPGFGCGNEGNSFDCSRCVNLGRDFYEYVHRNVTEDEVNIYNKRFSLIKLTMLFTMTSFNEYLFDTSTSCQQYSQFSQSEATIKNSDGSVLEFPYARLTLWYYRPVADCEQQKEADYCFNRGRYEIGYVIANYEDTAYFTAGEDFPPLKGKALYPTGPEYSGIGESLIYQLFGAPPGTLSGTPDMIDRVDFTYPSSIELK